MRNCLLWCRARLARLAALCMMSCSMLILLSMTGCSWFSNPPPPAVINNSPLRKEVDTELARELDAWYSHVMNDEHTAGADAGAGGFHSQFDADWNRLPGQGRFVVFQSRLTWTAAEVARRRPELASKYLPIAAHGLDFLATKQWDATNGGFFWEVAEPGH